MRLSVFFTKLHIFHYTHVNFDISERAQRARSECSPDRRNT